MCKYFILYLQKTRALKIAKPNRGFLPCLKQQKPSNIIDAQPSQSSHSLAHSVCESSLVSGSEHGLRHVTADRSQQPLLNESHPLPTTNLT